MPGHAKIDKLAGVASTFGAKGLAWIAFREDGSINSPIVKFFSDEEMGVLRERMNVEPGDLRDVRRRSAPAL